MKNCLLKDCTNLTDNDFCPTCFNMLTSGKVGVGHTFIHEINKYKIALEEALVYNLLIQLETQQKT